MMWPPIGIIDIDSNPPETITSAPLVRMRSLAIAIVCKPDEQKRLIVIALVSTGRPARIAAARATFMPCSASGMAQPMITSSISEADKPGTRAMASLITAAPMSSGRVLRKVPFGALPTAVRTADTITASFIDYPKTTIRDYPKTTIRLEAGYCPPVFFAFSLCAFAAWREPISRKGAKTQRNAK